METDNDVDIEKAKVETYFLEKGVVLEIPTQIVEEVILIVIQEPDLFTNSKNLVSVVVNAAMAQIVF